MFTLFTSSLLKITWKSTEATAWERSLFHLSISCNGNAFMLAVSLHLVVIAGLNHSLPEVCLDVAGAGGAGLDLLLLLLPQDPLC